MPRALLLCACLLLLAASEVYPLALSKSSGNEQQSALVSSDTASQVVQQQDRPSFVDWDGSLLDENPLEQVAAFLDLQEQQHAESKEKALADGDGATGTSLIQTGMTTGVGKVHAFCEICILIMQMKERGQPHLCAGLNPDYFISCVENLESLLRADKAVTYWLRSGCMHLDREGPEIVKPCPAHSICAWVPNLFADVGIVTPRNELSPLCPRDFKYLPRIPRKPAASQPA